MIWIAVFIFLIFLYVAILEFSPVRKLPLKEEKVEEGKRPPESLKVYKAVCHIHTQFSFDSLGKPEDIKKAMEKNNIDFAFITDHNNDDFKYFEDEKMFAGVEENTENGRILKLANELPVISHPNNPKVKHYRWTGEFKEGYLYELLNFKDVLTVNRKLVYMILVKNILLFPFFKNLTRKWNLLMPLEQWVKVYFEKASHLKVISGLDLQIKVAYKESTYQKSFPSYDEGFKWLTNLIITDEKVSNKEQILSQLSKGNTLLTANQREFLMWLEDEKPKPIGEKVKAGASLFIFTEEGNTVKVVKKDNQILAITTKNSFKILLLEKGRYHLECYEYDFKLGNIYFGYRPVCVSNVVEVV